MDKVIWINASAGSGKTKKLIDRILFLLLNGVAPSEILCVTFTKAAAVEMDERLELKAFELFNASFEHIKQLISDLECKNIKEASAIAVNLYNILKTDKVNIKTVHGFAKTIVENFADKYNFDKNFSILSEAEKKNMLKYAIKNVIKKAFKTNSYVNKSLKILSYYFNEEQLLEHLNLVLMHSERIANKSAIQTLNDYNEKFYLKISLDDEFYTLKEQVYKDLKKNAVDDLKKIVILLEVENSLSQKRIIIEELLQKVLSDENALKDEFIYLFLTKNLEKKKNIKISKNSLVNDLFANIQSCIFNSLQKYAAYENCIISFSLTYILQQILEEYQQLKLEKNILDYDDIINYSIKILKNENYQEILYKIDSNVNHLLVDEAQDTNNYQWDILKLITDEFFAHKDDDAPRSIFIVGDIKQSIYSFQGVNVESFIKMKHLFQGKANIAQKKWHEETSNTSYRTNDKILTIVDSVFEDEYINKNMPLMEGVKVEHKAFFDRKGYVEIYPLVTKLENCFEHDSANVTNTAFSQEDSETEVFKKHSSLIVDIVQKKLQEQVPSMNRCAQPGDFFVLFQKRSKLMNQVAYDLKKANIPVSGVDKIKINESPLIMDLIAIAKFLACPLDDMNLSILLKGPFFNISDHELFALCSNREEKLFVHLKSLNNNIYKKLHNWIALSKNISIYEFFVMIIDGEHFGEILLRRFGEAARNLIDNFYNLIEEYQAFEIKDYDKFAFWILSSECELKNISHDKNQVKLMTVHGSKGLEAPYVILADANISNKKNTNIIFEDGLLIYLLNAKEKNVSDICKRENDKTLSEYYRLLYVAMTRAKDALIVTGSESRYKSENSWYSKISHAVNACLRNDDGNNDSIIKFGDHFACAQDNCIGEQLPTRNINYLPKNPIEFGIYDIAKDYSCEQKRNTDEVKGQIFHEAISMLNETNNLDYIKNYINSKTNITDETKTIINDKVNEIYRKFNWFFGDNAITEQAFLLQENGLMQEGRVDLMIDFETHIKIIDFKFYENEILDDDIKTQVQFYKKAVFKITNKKIKNYIFWVNSMTLEEIDL